VTTEAKSPLTLPEALTTEFYEWERRGRGWEVWPYRVRLEPRCQPFFHTLPFSPQLAVDDGRHPTLLSTLVDRLMGRRQAIESPSPQSAPEPWAQEADASKLLEPLIEMEVALPPTLDVDRKPAEQLLLSLASASQPVGFEIIGTSNRIVSQVSCRESDRELVRQQVKAHFPEAVIVRSGEGLRQQWSSRTTGATAIVDFGLAREFMVPLRTWKTFDADPLVGIFGALATLADGEIGVFQILFETARHPWAESVMRAMTDGEGGSFFADAPRMVSLATEKVSHPLFSVVVRVGARSASEGRVWQIARSLGGALKQFGTPGLNEFIPLERGQYDESDHEEDLLSRWSCRCGALLNSEELVSFAHLPSASVRIEKFARQVKKTKAAPAATAGQHVVLGENLHDGKTVQVGLSVEQRLRHSYVIGASGTGKSTLLLNMIVQDIQKGEGVGVLDPHGDLIDQILGHIPENRFKDVVLLDPADEAFPVGFNILSAHSEVEKNLLASDLVSVFRRLSTSWGDQMTSVLGNAVLAFLESPEGGTLADLRRFLIEPDFRRTFLSTVKDSEVVYYWQKEFPLLAGKPQGPVLTRLDTFLRPKLVRHIVSQKKDRLDFGAIMNGGKIFLAKLAQGAIGEENAYLLGTLLVSKVQQLTMSRQELQESERRPFYLYIDEFHNFVTPSMAAILTGARKYRLGLVLAHQDLRQIGSRDPELANAILGAHARICFRVGDQDAQKLAEGFSAFSEKDLQNLGIGEAICRIERAEYDFNLKTLPLPTVGMEVSKRRREQVVALSRQAYATPKEQVEVALRREAPEMAAPPLPRERIREMREQPIASTSKAPAREQLEPPPLRSSAPSIPTPGRGGPEHKRLQHFLKNCGESRGYRATIEKPILEGLGSVDVVLEKGELKIACEVSVTSTPEQELGNVQKCLQAGFEHILVMSPEHKILGKVRKSVAKGLGESDLARVRFVLQDEVFPFLDELDACAAGTETTVRGYRSKKQYRAVGQSEGATKRRNVTQVLVGAFRRLRGKGSPSDDDPKQPPA
jgi:hypothetical protein